MLKIFINVKEYPILLSLFRNSVLQSVNIQFYMSWNLTCNRKKDLVFAVYLIYKILNIININYISYYINIWYKYKLLDFLFPFIRNFLLLRKNSLSLSLSTNTHTHINMYLLYISNTKKQEIYSFLNEL